MVRSIHLKQFLSFKMRYLKNQTFPVQYCHYSFFEGNNWKYPHKLEVVWYDGESEELSYRKNRTSYQILVILETSVMLTRRWLVSEVVEDLQQFSSRQNMKAINDNESLLFTDGAVLWQKAQLMLLKASPYMKYLHTKYVVFILSKQTKWSKYQTVPQVNQPCIIVALTTTKTEFKLNTSDGG